VSGGRGPTGRSLTDLIVLVLAMRHDPLTEQFDQLLTDAETTGGIEPALARSLRWWQRQSLQAQSDYFAEALPRILAALEAADVADRAALDQAVLAWEAAEPSARPRPPGAILMGSAGTTSRVPESQSVAPQTPSVARDAAPRSVEPKGAEPTSGSPSGVVPGRLLIAGLTVKPEPDTTPAPNTRVAPPDPPP